MGIASLVIFAGMVLMAEPSNEITIKLGKQLSQSLTIQVADGDIKQDVTIRYLLFVPEGYENNQQPWPLLLFLHGLGESSDTDLDRVKIHGPAKMVETQPDFPFVLVTPQCPPPGKEKADIVKAWKPAQLIQLVDLVARKLRIDDTRIYVTGLSMGGYGTWRLAAAHPERFAAILPICGGGEPDTMTARLRGVPIWAFHGAKDSVVPVSESEKIVDAVTNAGGNVRLTVYADAGHDSWTQTYSNPEVYDWLLSHQKPSR
jgi:predicted peptidase